MPLPFRARSLCSALALVVTGLSACDDGPTAPAVFTHPAAGQQWVAVRLPEQVPDARTWLAYVRGNGADLDPAALRARTLHQDSERFRRAGELERARDAEAEAALAAAAALTTMPSARVLIGSMGAIDHWIERARGAGAGEEFAPLRAAAEEVRTLRASAAARLEEGDTVAAVVDLARAGNIARGYAPEAVAVRVLTEAEGRLAAQRSGDPDAVRATRLLHNARAALAEGDNPRALRRALYALQLAERLVAIPSAGERRAPGTE